MKNRIINGGMVIDQRNAGASTTPTASGYTLDRWRAGLSVASKFSVQQSSTAPTGFTKSTLLTSTSAYTVGASEQFQFAQIIEGYNIADFGFGASSAATITLSFWARSSLTGTFGLAIRNGDSSRIYCPTYTISSANTWEQKTVTIPGDVTGTWATDNTAGLIVYFNLGMGSGFQGTANVWQAGTYYGPTGATNLVSTNGATLYITGVQLEKGSTATSFDYRPYGTELALCQRYYYRWTSGQTGAVLCNMSAYNSTSAWGKILDLPVTMRAIPTCTAVGTFRAYPSNGSGGVAFTSTGISSAQVTVNSITTSGWTGSSGLTAGICSVVDTGTTTTYVDASAEL